jgi:hypothetical protein
MDVANPQKSGNVGVMRLRGERIPEKDNQVHLAARYQASNLKVSPLGPSQHALHVQARAFHDISPGRARGYQLARPKQVDMLSGEHHNIHLLGVMSDKGDGRLVSLPFSLGRCNRLVLQIYLLLSSLLLFRFYCDVLSFHFD